MEATMITIMIIGLLSSVFGLLMIFAPSIVIKAEESANQLYMTDAALMKNRIPLNVSSVPPVNLDEVVWYWDENTLMDSTFSFIYTANIFPQLSYTNVSSYLRRLNFDYKIEFFADPADGAKVTITTAS